MSNTIERTIQGIPYSIRSNQRLRRVLVSIRPNGSVLVSKPIHVPISAIERLLERKLEWIKEAIVKQKSQPKKLLAHYSAKDFKEHKENARKIAQERLLYFNQFYNHTINKIYIRNQKSRWGSCSGKGNLNFNYKIVFLPKELIDYIIVHELCHIKEMNHSDRFWNLVAKQIPNYKELQKAIKIY